MRRLFHRPALAFAAGAVLVAVVVGGRAAYAALTDDVITACFKPSNGTLYLVGDGSQRADCQPGDRPISWNAQGPAGQPGRGRRRRRQRHERRTRARRGRELPARREQVHRPRAASPTHATAASSRRAGARTAPSGSGSTTPASRWRVRVGGSTSTTSGVTVDAVTTLRLRGALVDFDALATMDIDAGAPLSIDAALVMLNGSGCGVLRNLDVNPVIGPNGGPVLLNPVGSPTVRTRC